MANQEALEILKKRVTDRSGNLTAWNEWRTRNPGIKPDLVGADLPQAHLSRVNLRRADLREANLSGADLLEANLNGANLSEANLGAAHLTRANLAGANLSRANLTDADLTRANLSEADLSGAHHLGEPQRGGPKSGGLPRLRYGRHVDWKC